MAKSVARATAIMILTNAFLTSTMNEQINAILVSKLAINIRSTEFPDKLQRKVNEYLESLDGLQSVKPSTCTATASNGEATATSSTASAAVPASRFKRRKVAASRVEE